MGDISDVGIRLFCTFRPSSFAVCIHLHLDAGRAVFDGLPRLARRDFFPQARNMRIRAILEPLEAYNRQERAIMEVEEVRKRDFLYMR
jgi:hypothetical protein